MSTKKLVKKVLYNLFGTCIYQNKVVLGYYNRGKHDTKTISSKKYAKAVDKFKVKKPLLFNILSKQQILIKPSYLK